METTHNFSTISPSARALLLLKGNTNIPYALQAAELISLPDKYIPGYADKSLSTCLRIAHFEARYLSIDQLLSGLPVKNILELSSGFSFRSLDAVQQKDVYYIDTDLPGIIEEKTILVTALQHEHHNTTGTLEIRPLNALDETAFTETINHFPDGEIAIVNEGLLMYLNIEEKEKLCSIIHKVLKQRGGYWITADIYIKTPRFNTIVQMDDDLEKFLEQHNIEENKFDSIEAAEAFFKKCGFVIDKEAEIDYSKLNAIPFIMQKLTPEQMQEMSKAGRPNATWRLKIA